MGNRIDRNIAAISIIAVALSAAYSFSQLFFGLDFTDSFYYLSSFKLDELVLSRLGFQLFGYGWTNVFGETIISVRIANWLFYAASFVLAYIWFVPAQQRMSRLGLLALPFLLLPTFSLNIFNGDSCTLLIIVCVCKVMRDWGDRQVWLSGIVLGLLFYVAILFRFPNVVAIPLGFIPVLLFAPRKMEWVKYIFAAGASILLFALTQMLITHFGAASLASELTDGDGTNSLSNLIQNYWKDAKTILSFIPLCTLAIIACSESKLNRICGGLLSAVVFFFFAYYLECEVTLGHACWNLSLFVSSFFASMCLFGLYETISAESDNCFLPVTVLVMSLVNPAGSDTGLLKMVWLFVAFLPALLVFVLQSVNRKWLFCILVGSLTLFCIYGHYRHPFGEPPLPKLTCDIDNDMVRGVRTGASQYALYETVKKDVEEIGKNNVYIYGELSHGLNEMLGLKSKVETTFFMNANNASDIEAVRCYVVSEGPSVIFMPYKPDGAKTIFESRPEPTEFEKMLVSEGYQVSKKTDYYYIYSPTEQDR